MINVFIVLALCFQLVSKIHNQDGIFVTNPMSMINPNCANKVKWFNDKFNARKAPMAAIGMANKATNG